MKNGLKEWVKQFAMVAGVQACGLCFPDRTDFSLSFDPTFPADTLSNVWNCVVDTMRTTGADRLPVCRLRWVYEHALLHCLKRGDGICLMVFHTRKPQQVDLAALKKLFDEFEAPSV